MNKIYLEPIAKTEALARGVKSQAEMLAKKGIVVDADKLLDACRALEAAGSAQDAAEAKLKDARERAHNSLEALKELLIVSKTPIKQNFAPEVWQSFSLADKK